MYSVRSSFNSFTKIHINGCSSIVTTFWTYTAVELLHFAFAWACCCIVRRHFQWRSALESLTKSLIDACLTSKGITFWASLECSVLFHFVPFLLLLHISSIVRSSLISSHIHLKTFILTRSRVARSFALFVSGYMRSFKSYLDARELLDKCSSSCTQTDHDKHIVLSDTDVDAWVKSPMHNWEGGMEVSLCVISQV